MTASSTAPICDGNHRVQFYEDPAAIVRTVRELAERGLSLGQGVLLLMSRSNLAAVMASDSGMLATAAREGRAALVEVESVLPRILIGGQIDLSVFNSVIAGAVERLVARWGRVTAYGELVDALWSRGHHEATLALEAAWHALLQSRPLTLTCGYHLDRFANGDEVGFARICDVHTHVSPIEGQPRSDERGRDGAMHVLRGRSLVLERSRRAAAEAALERSEEFNRRIIDSSGDCIKVLELDGRLVSMNEGGLRAMGLCDIAGIVGSPYEGFWNGVDREHARRALDEGRAGRPGRFEGSCPTARGEPRWWDVLVTPMYGDDGQVARLLAVSRDVTAQHEQSERLLRTEERLAAALAAARVGTWSWDVVADRIVWDASLRRVVGLTDDEPLPTGAAFAEWIHPDDRQRTSAAIGDALAGLRPYDVEFRLRHADGSMHWHHSRGKVTFVDGQPVAMIGACVDVTELREAQEAIAATADKLQRSNTELEQFAYVASHDLQEPLRMVTQYLDLLERRLDSKLDDRERGYLRHAMEGGERMHALINDLLQYSRLGRADQPELRDVELDRVLAEVLDTLSPRLLQSGAAVTSESLPRVLGDPIQFAQVLQNLIANAVKFRGDAAPTVHLSAHESADAWEIRVRDNGIGIEPQHQQRIFEVFQRLHNRQQYPGTGIGLSICKKIVERAGGRIAVDSQPGTGSTFRFTIPKRAACVGSTLGDVEGTTASNRRT